MGAAGLGVLALSACSSTDRTNGAVPLTNETVPDTGGSAAASTLRWQHVPLGFVSSYVLVRGREAAVVDTGTESSAADITAGLGALGATPSDVRHVILTHRHGDHVGGLSGVLEAATNATVYAGAGDADAIRSAQPLQVLDGGDEVFGMGVIATPGHTPGSISLFDSDTGLLVAGDAINGDGGRIVGPNAEFSSDMDAALDSLEKLAALDAKVAAFGHGGEPIADDVAGQLRSLAER